MEKIKLPTKKLPERTPEERTEYQEKRELKVVEQNHQMAVAAVEIEKLISAYDPSDLKDEPLRSALENLPLAWQEGFREMIKGYFRKRKSAKEGEDRIMLKSGAEWVAAEKISETAGQWLFKEMTKEDSEDLVTFQKKEGYFILHYANEEDYFLACYGRDKKTGVVKKTSEAGSHFDWLVVEGGSGYDVSTLMIKGKERSLNSLVVHERQHFINHKVMRMFSDQEPKRRIDLLSPPWEERNSLRKIKDEVLAYIRDGSDGETLITALSVPLYAHLFKGLKSDTEAKTKAVIQTVGDFLDHQAGTLKEDERAMLVYQLFHVSFLEFPKWLALIEKYYLRRQELAKSFRYLEADDDHVINFFEYGSYFLKEDTFPSEYIMVARDLFKEAAEISRSIFEFKQAGLAAAYNLRFTEKEAEEVVKNLLRKYQEAVKELKKIVEPLRRNGVFVPHASFRNVQFAKEKKDGLVIIGLGETSSTEKIKQAVINQVVSFPSEKINAISNFLYRSEGRKEMRSDDQRELADLITSIVQQLNNGNFCIVFFDKDYGTTGFFWVRVRFGPGQEDKDAGIALTNFDIVFHGSPGEK